MQNVLQLENQVDPIIASTWIKQWQEDQYHTLVGQDNFVQAWDFKRDDLKALYEHFQDRNIEVKHLRFFLAMSGTTSFEPRNVRLLAQVGTKEKLEVLKFPGENLDKLYVSSSTTHVRADFKGLSPKSLANPVLGNTMPGSFQYLEENREIDHRLAKAWINQYIQAENKRVKIRSHQEGTFKLIHSWAFPVENFTDMLFMDAEVASIRFYLGSKSNVKTKDFSFSGVAKKDQGATALIISGAASDGMDLIDRDWGIPKPNKTLYNFGSPCPPICSGWPSPVR